MKTKASIFLFFILLLSGAQCNTGQKDIAKSDINSVFTGEGDTLVNRRPAVAGTFYPGNREALMKQLGELFTSAAPNQKLDNIVALISPHAGYVYSGTVAASAYNQLSPAVKYDNIFIIGSSHYYSFDGAAIYSEGNFITPIGIARVNIPLAKKLLKENPAVFFSNTDVQASEHSVEVQIPFLQYIYKDELQIIPVLLGTQKPGTCRKIADALLPYLNGHNLFIISTDFSHFPDYQDATKVDALTAGAILGNSASGFLKTIADNNNLGISNLATSICGWPGMLTFLDITEKNQDIQYHKIRYMNSGDTPEGEKNRVVGYQAMAVTLAPDEAVDGNDSYSLTNTEKDRLLDIARTTISTYLETGEIAKINTNGFGDKLLSHSGAFVTLNKKGALRGCIGMFTADIPLYQVIQEMAIFAATRDSRFDPVSPEELNQIEIEISVLTPMRKIGSVNEIILGRHGIYIKKGDRAGTFLPQVATQTGWDLQEFLGHCSRDKAGIGWDGWKDAEIYVYEAYVFGEQ